MELDYENFNKINMNKDEDETTSTKSLILEKAKLKVAWRSKS